LNRLQIFPILAAVLSGGESSLKLKAWVGGLALLSLTGSQLPAAEWKVVERERAYPVRGVTGAELYDSIGERGPKVAGTTRAIAHTTFKLTWKRDYQQRDGSCVLASATPKLTISYTLPKPAARLTGTVKSNWDFFIAGVRVHEKVHGEMIKDMVREIERVSVGLSAADDPDCMKVRAELQTMLADISREQRRKGQEFDQLELGNGGNIHQLILRLVNGG
jgi:predicted secreted Zn-dependent protease